VLGDPVNLVDPNGTFVNVFAGAVAGAIGGTIVGAFDAYKNGRCLTEGFKIFITDLSFGILGEAMAGAGNVGPLVAGLTEVGGVGLNAVNGFYAAVPDEDPCNPKPSCE
jgi:mannitol-specific phosphotransferase system IIBC component